MLNEVSSELDRERERASALKGEVKDKKNLPKFKTRKTIKGADLTATLAELGPSSRLANLYKNTSVKAASAPWTSRGPAI